MPLAYLAQYIFHRHLTILEIQLYGGGAFVPPLMFFRPLAKSFKAALNNKGREFIAINLGKYGIYVCKTAIGDPTFLPVQDIIFSIICQAGRGFCTQCITTAVGFCEAIS